MSKVDVFNHPVLPSTGWAPATDVTFRSVGIPASLPCGKVDAVTRGSFTITTIIYGESSLYTPLSTPSASVCSSVDGNIPAYII